MSVFDDLVGQAAVRAQLERAAIAARDLAERTTDGEADRDSAMSQAWLITGPPGSGRSLVARAFAAALQCTGPAPGCGRCRACRTVMEGKHPDVEHVATEGVVITVDQTRDLVGRSFVSPGSGAWRVVIVEDADRMAERTTNVLLKAIEEPPPFTVWMLCTPSPEDVMTTIRSRCRGVALAVPPASDVAALLVRRDGVAPEEALRAARAAQSHVGRARALATDSAVRRERDLLIGEALAIRGTADAVLAAHRVHAQAVAAAKKATGDRFEREEAELKRTLGIGEGARIPPAARAQLRELAENQKRRTTRAQRDELDRAMIDLLSLYRDVLTVQLGAGVDLVNQDFDEGIRAVAAESDPGQSVRRMDAIAQARTRLGGNVAPLLVLEAMMVALRPQG
ncbi:DNA polymerase III, delta' subunit [Actinobaculum sp. oral taxon 183 str. F0552]|uniref:DNA polymerase III subunit delta' n=1 Tax=Actinobaculum sp. oral taxon 183 TaxID=712888 RepID=UPI000397CEEA|nr:DNA polymerase III subunit delta' [Actinobaculum sp. oral taxon 183]ERH17773.1 DNA polymerase III, delta' subunit [Actinobaculum sp. oral taxon 183 str. F0552]